MPQGREIFPNLTVQGKLLLRVSAARKGGGGAYTLAVWSYDEHHTPKDGRVGAGYGRSQEIEARRAVLDQIDEEPVEEEVEDVVAAEVARGQQEDLRITQGT